MTTAWKMVWREGRGAPLERRLERAKRSEEHLESAWVRWAEKLRDWSMRTPRLVWEETSGMELTGGGGEKDALDLDLTKIISEDLVRLSLRLLLAAQLEI
jgi:hypothetical protein